MQSGGRSRNKQNMDGAFIVDEITSVSLSGSRQWELPSAVYRLFLSFFPFLNKNRRMQGVDFGIEALLPMRTDSINAFLVLVCLPRCCMILRSFYRRNPSNSCFEQTCRVRQTVRTRILFNPRWRYEERLLLRDVFLYQLSRSVFRGK